MQVLLSFQVTGKHLQTNRQTKIISGSVLRLSSCELAVFVDVDAFYTRSPVWAHFMSLLHKVIF